MSTATEIEAIKAIVAKAFGVTVAEVDCTDRNEPLPRIRHVAMTLAYNMVGASLPDVAEAFHRSNHASVRHAIEQTRARCAISPTFKARVTKIEDECIATLKLKRKGTP